MGGRYRFAVTVCGAFGLVFTSRKLLQPLVRLKKPTSSEAYLVFILESHPESEIDTARRGEITEVDTSASRSSHRSTVAVHDWVQPSVVGEQEQVCSFDKNARVSTPQESISKGVTQLQVPEPHPVDVLLDEQLFAHVGVVGCLNGRDNDDVVDSRRGGVLFPVSQHARNNKRVVSVQRRRGETSCRQVMLGRIEHVSASPEIEQQIQGEPIVLEGVRETDRIIWLPVVTSVDERARSERKTVCRIDQEIA